MKKCLIGMLASTLILGSASVYAATVVLDGVTVKAGDYNSISLDKLQSKFVYDIECNIININNGSNVTLGVQQRYGSPNNVFLNGKAMTKAENNFYQGNLVNESNELIIRGVTDKSGSFLGDYLYFHNDAGEGTGFNLKVSNCIAKATSD